MRQENAGSVSEHANLESTIAVEPQSRLVRFTEWYSSKKTSLVFASIVVANALLLTNHQYGELKELSLEAAPWVIGGIAASEGMFIGGAAMMAASVGSTIGNPLTIKKKIPDLARRSDQSRLFNSGFWINAAGAVGTAGVVGAGVATVLPAEALPLMAIPAADIAFTIKIRMMIKDAIRSSVPYSTES